MEFGKDLITRILENYEFDMSKIDIDKIQHVPMHEWRISTNSKPLLLIENLQCCIGLYAYGNGIAFAAHINTVVFDKDEYVLNTDGKPIYCNRCDDLVKEILKYDGKIKEPFKVGIAFGDKPLNKEEASMSLIYEGIDNSIKRLNFLNIPVDKLDDVYNPFFLIDSVNNKIISPINEEIKKNK